MLEKIKELICNYVEVNAVVLNTPEKNTAEVIVKILHFSFRHSVYPVLKAEVQTVVFGAVHDGKIQRLSCNAVGVPEALVRYIGHFLGVLF